MANNRHAIGKSVPFKGGPGKVTGQAKYLDDLELPGMLYAKIRMFEWNGADNESGNLPVGFSGNV